ncbi:hypothetical protein X801_05150, partial [Opisthorchis viverrini]
HLKACCAIEVSLNRLTFAKLRLDSTGPNRVLLEVWDSVPLKLPGGKEFRPQLCESVAANRELHPTHTTSLPVYTVDKRQRNKILSKWFTSGSESPSLDILLARLHGLAPHPSVLSHLSSLLKIPDVDRTTQGSLFYDHEKTSMRAALVHLDQNGVTPAYCETAGLLFRPVSFGQTPKARTTLADTIGYSQHALVLGFLCASLLPSSNPNSLAFPCIDEYSLSSWVGYRAEDWPRVVQEALQNYPDAYIRLTPPVRRSIPVRNHTEDILNRKTNSGLGIGGVRVIVQVP